MRWDEIAHVFLYGKTNVHLHITHSLIRNRRYQRFIATHKAGLGVTSAATSQIMRIKRQLKWPGIL